MNASNLQLDISIRLTDSQYGGQGLSMNQSIFIKSIQFLEVAKILGQFHELALQIERERGGK